LFRGEKKRRYRQAESRALSIVMPATPDVCVM